MPRFCSYCAKPLTKPDGSVDWKRRFCDRACANADNKERKQLRRSGAGGKRCPLCGQKPSRNSRVCADKPESGAHQIAMVAVTKSGEIVPLERAQ